MHAKNNWKGVLNFDLESPKEFICNWKQSLFFLFNKDV